MNDVVERFDELGRELEKVSIAASDPSSDTFECNERYNNDIKIKTYASSFDLRSVDDKPDLRNLKYCTPTEHLLCPICQQPFIKPLTTICGHTFCKDCIYECFKMSRDSLSDGFGLCPLDRTLINSTDSNELFPTPILINNLVDELHIYCLNSERGCDWTGARWEIDHHVLSDCKYTGVECEGKRANGKVCKLLVERRFLMSDDENEEGEKEDQEDVEKTNIEFSECVHRIYQCPFCVTEITKLNEEDHLQNECLFNYKTCELCLNDMIPMKNLNKHKENCTKLGKFLCPANSIGCKFVGHNGPSLDNHMENSCQLNGFLPYYELMNDKINTLSGENHYLQREINKILNLVIQGKITNLGYNEPIEEINKFSDIDEADKDKLIYFNYEIDRLKYQIDEKLIPFVNKQTNEREPILNNLINDNFMMKDDLNLQRMLINSLRKQIQFILFKNHRPSFTGLGSQGIGQPLFEDTSDFSDSDERMNLKL